jgi:hypothetical protein
VGDAKRLVVKPISAQDGNRIVRQLHYSGKVVNNSQVHLGAFLDGKCGGAMQFGPSLDKRKIQGLVRGTLWNEFIELNRMAFADWLPRNGESRCIGYAMRWMRETYPWLKWVISFADATQCGDGAIYRASGFALTGIKPNNQIWEAPTGEVFNDTSIRPGIGGERERERAARVFSRTSLTDGRSKQQQQQQQALAVLNRTTTKGKHILNSGASSMKAFAAAGWKPKDGFQLRYIYFLDPTERDRLTVPVIPFSEIERRGASMYRGKKRAVSIASDASAIHAAQGGATPTTALSEVPA